MQMCPKIYWLILQVNIFKLAIVYQKLVQTNWRTRWDLFAFWLLNLLIYSVCVVYAIEEQETIVWDDASPSQSEHNVFECG